MLIRNCIRTVTLMMIFGFTLQSPGEALSPQQEIDQQVPAALKIIDAWQNIKPEAGVRNLNVVYWTPSDREPQPKYQERLSALLLDIQSFYRREMKRNGFGERTVQFQMADEKLIKIHVVKSSKPYKEFKTESGRAIRTECIPFLKQAGIDADKETIVIFCNMSNYDEKAATINQNSPYYAGGGKRGGTAWQVDSAILNLDLLDKKEPVVRDGQYGKISVGRYNTIFIGGVCHELGHAISLPHNAARPDQAALWGTSLMGSGNRTYGEERRGEGKGSFLVLADALRLATHPMFCGSIKGIDQKPQVKLDDIKCTPGNNSLTVTAKVVADPPAYAVIAYTDPEGHGDYDSTTATAIPDATGNITLNCNTLKKGKGELRLVVLNASGSNIGDRHYLANYTVADDGTVKMDAATTKPVK